MFMKDDENKSAWLLELGLYPGILIGMRSYAEEDCTIHVIYFPFFDISLTIFK